MILSPYVVGQAVMCRFDGPFSRLERGVVCKVTTFPDRQAFHIVELRDGEYGFGTDDLSPCETTPIGVEIGGEGGGDRA